MTKKILTPIVLVSILSFLAINSDFKNENTTSINTSERSCFCLYLEPFISNKVDLLLIKIT